MAKRMLKVRIADGNFALKEGYISIDDIAMFRESNVDCNHSIVHIHTKTKAEEYKQTLEAYGKENKM